EILHRLEKIENSYSTSKTKTILDVERVPKKLTIGCSKSTSKKEDLRDANLKRNKVEHLTNKMVKIVENGVIKVDYIERNKKKK
ncbi:33738_t:CDS:1, partial [Gigaspora margarita]